MTDARTLLAEYAQTGSESAFQELVVRYLALVYSTALRQVGGDRHLAEDVAQTVFLHLARKASRLPDQARLGGWLYQDTCHVAATVLRGERRRYFRESRAAEMNALQGSEDRERADLLMALDSAINQLASNDRLAIVLRFFEERDFQFIGASLNSSEDAARMRVNRALEKLQTLLKRRGLALSTTALATALASETLAAVPPGLAATIAGTALAVPVTSGILPFAKFGAIAKSKLAILTALVIGSVVTLLVLQTRTEIRSSGDGRLQPRGFDRSAQTDASQSRPSGRANLSNVAPSVNTRVPDPRAMEMAQSPTTSATLDKPAASLVPGPSAFAAAVPAGELVRFTSRAGSKVRIDGTSTLHDWQVAGAFIAGFLEVGAGFPLSAGQPPQVGPIQVQGELSIPAQYLASVEKDGKPYSDRMDQSMQEMLKAAENPRIRFHLAQLSLKGATNRADGFAFEFESTGDLAIAGVTNGITMPVFIAPLSDARLKISGQTAIKMTDFRIDPAGSATHFPDGLLRVGNIVTISFDWMLQRTNEAPAAAAR